MSDLSIKYMGLSLRNPLIVSSSNLTSSVEKVVACEEAGAGAVVLKSLFEEQIAADTKEMLKDVNEAQLSSAYEYLNRAGSSHYMDNYFGLVEEAKKKVSIPVIASINCTSAGTWIDYATRFEKVGADAIEFNVFVLPADVNKKSNEIESIYLELCRKIKRKIHIPFSLKIGSHFTGLANILKQLSDEGARGLVLFNRFYQPDVNIDKFKIVPANIMSAPEEMLLSLRWIALLSGEIESDFAAATGIHDSKSIIKQLLVGAKAVQLCTVLFQRKLEIIGILLREIEEWMSKHDFKSIGDFCGMLCQERSDKPEVYERAQYVKALVGIS